MHYICHWIFVNLQKYFGVALIDFLCVATIVAGLALGWIKGMVKQLASALALILAVLIARAPGDELAEIMTSLVPELSHLSYGNWVADMLAHIFLFLFVYISIMLITSMVRSVVHGLHLGIFDRIGGSAFAALKYLLALSLLLNLWLMLSPDSEFFKSPRLLDGKVSQFTIDLAPKVLNSTLMTESNDSISTETTNDQP